MRSQQAGPAWRISRQHRRRCLISVCYYVLRCQAVVSTSRNVDQQCPMTLSSSPSPPFYRKGEYPVKGICASLRGSQALGSQALVLDSVPFCTAPCWASSGKDVVQLHAVIKPCAVRFSRPLGKGQGSAPGPSSLLSALGWHPPFCPRGRVMKRILTTESNGPSISLGNDFEYSIFLGKVT